jgi:transaldolase
VREIRLHAKEEGITWPTLSCISSAIRARASGSTIRRASSFKAANSSGSASPSARPGAANRDGFVSTEVDPAFAYDAEATITEATRLQGFQDHGRVRPTLEEGVDEARALREQLAEAGIDYDHVTSTLERDDVQSFAGSFSNLLDGIRSRLAAASPRPRMAKTRAMLTPP